MTAPAPAVRAEEALRTWQAGLPALGRQLRAGERSSEQLVQLSLAAIGALDAQLNAFVHVATEAALAAAREADSELAAGQDRGPLHGIPVAVKDIIDVQGLPTTRGSALLRTARAESDADCVALLRQAGAIVLGKTTLHEFAYGITGDRSAQGPSRNPWDPQRISGGSSGGSAVAVAAGLVPLALGTDTVGSVRVPAALCGVFGFKPGFDAIPVAGSGALAHSLDHIGLLALSAEDLALAYRVLAPRDALQPRVDSARVGWIDPALFTPADERVVARARFCVQEGTCGLREIDFAPLLPATPMFELVSTLQRPEAYEEHAEELRRGEGPIDDEVLARLNAGIDIPAWRYVRAARQREAFAAGLEALWREVDVLALPTTPMTAPRLGERAPLLAGAPVEVRSTLLALTSPWNLARLPALSVPVGWVDGLPVAAQLVTRRGNEAQLFELAATVQRAARRHA